MWQSLGALVDFFHAMMMVAWIAGIPLLFVHAWPRITRVYGGYAIAFIIVSQVSRRILGECFLTTIARACWRRAWPAVGVSQEWFTVRLASAVFHLTPSHRSVVLLFEGLMLVMAVGVLWSLRRLSGGMTPPRGPLRQQM